jgi:hypothetical protein
MAGTVKSTIARTVARAYFEQNQLGASFFFSRGGRDVGNAAKFVTSIAVQLANNVQSLRRNIYDVIAKRSDIASQSLPDQWRHLVLGPLSKLKGNKRQSRYVLVIDALDECDDDNNIRMILQLLAEARSLKTVRLRVFLTSRPENPIQHIFDHMSEAEHQDFVLHRISPSIVDYDISIFLKYKLGLIGQQHRIASGWPEEKAVVGLVQNAGGLFIWAATACLFIGQNGQLAERRLSLLQHSNSTLPPERKLDEIYTTVLTNSVQGGFDEEETIGLRNRFRQIVGPIITLQDPLSVSGKEVGDVRRTLTHLHSVLDVPDDNNGAIRLLHPSFRDFLLDQKRCSNPQFYIDEILVHREMYLNCLQVMSQHLRRNICNLRRPGADISELSRSEVDTHIQPYVQYACRFWVYHYKRSDIGIGGYNNIEKFLRKHFLHWLEALALLGCASDAVVMIHILDSGFLVRNFNSAATITS